MKHLLFTTLCAATALSVSAQTFTSINLGTPQNVNGPSFALPTPIVGATYKYPNAATNVDAYVTITGKTNDHTSASTASDAVGVFAIDNPAAINGGYDYAFQPVVSSSNTNSSGLWTAGNCGNGTVTISHSADQNYLVHFRIYFKKAGTQTDTALNLHAAFIDIDGFGGGSEAEQDAFMPGVSYATDPNTTLTFTQRADGLINAEGDPANVTGLQLTQTTAITQVTYLARTYVDFAFGMNTHSAQNRGGCYASVSGGRLKSVSFATQPGGLTTVTPTKINLNGRVWDDANGSANNTFTNIFTAGENFTNGGGLYVYAIDPVSNTVIGSATVSAVDGRYSITDVPQNQTVYLLLTKTALTVGASGVSNVGVLNSGWVATSPLIRTVAIGTVTIGDLQFGIERTPTSTPYSVTIATPVANSIKTLTTASGLAPLAGTDPEDGTLGATYKVVISSIAALNGNKLYYNGVELHAGDTISNYNTSLLTIKFTNNTASSAGFTFNFIDKAGRGGIAANYLISWTAAPPSNPLGVKLESFNGKNEVSYNDLHWITASETNLNHYELERSSDGQSFASIATVATRSAEGNSTIRQEYSYTDQSPIAKAYYRLKIVDNDATITYSPVITLESRNLSNGQLQVYPNPGNGTMTISGVENLSASQIHVLNASGQSIAYSVLAADANAHTTTIQLSNAPAGLYYISCESKAGVSSARILVK